MIFEVFESRELFEIVKEKIKLPENEACHYFYCVLKTLQKLAEAGLVHRDIKAENILVREDTKELKLIDFGFAMDYSPDSLVKSACGSPNYAAPEVLAKEKYEPLKADIWSAGVLLFYMLSGTLLLTKASCHSSTMI